MTFPDLQTTTVPAVPHVARSRAYSFALDDQGNPIELGSGRFAKAYLGEERWLDSRIGFHRAVAIKALQRGVSAEDRYRFQTEKDILERVQGHANIVEVLASGVGDIELIPPVLRDRVEPDFIVLELMDLSLEARLHGSHQGRRQDDLLALPPTERLLTALDYVVPPASAVEFAHLARDTCHRDIKPANILLRMPSSTLAGDQLKVKLADFNVGKTEHDFLGSAFTRFQNVPGTLYFQSPEQELNTFELLVNTTRGSNVVDFFEDFYIDINENDQFSLFNRSEIYSIVSTDRVRKKIHLARPWSEPNEINVRARIAKAVGRPADIYSLGALFYYLVSGAYANPKSLYDTFRSFCEYDRDDESNTVTAFIEHEYHKVQSLRAPRSEGNEIQIAPQDRFFSFKQYLDGNGELIDPRVMLVIAKAMIRNKPDSYCLAWDLQTGGISELVRDLLALYPHSTSRTTRSRSASLAPIPARPMRRAWDRLFRRRTQPPC